jgi:ribosome-binding factor A
LEKGYSRVARVGDLIMEEVSRMILKGEIKDPRVSSVVITGVKVTKDMGVARLFFTTMTPEQNREEAMRGLRSAKGFIRKELSKRLRMKKVPDVAFEIDTSLEVGYRVDELLRKVKGE